jgi:fumarylacetoacetate (FAA) hydrolase
VKLATLPDGTLDGTLILVSNDLSHAVHCADIAPSLLTAVQQWEAVEPHLRERAEQLERGGRRDSFPFEPRCATAPLPRAPQLLDGSAFKTHGDLMGRAFGTTLPDNVYTDAPLMYQGTSDDLLGPYDDVVLPSEADGIDFEAEIVVITAGVKMASSATAAAGRIRLIGVMNDVSLRNVARAEIATGFGFIQAKPRSSFAAVLVTPDELGDAWHDGRVHLPVSVSWNGRPFGAPSAGAMSFSFGELIAHAARRRTLSAGTIVGSGTISNDAYATVGSACIAERRMIETIDSGAPQTEFMRFGDRVRIEMLDAAGRSLCGPIDQRIVALT